MGNYPQTGPELNIPYPDPQNMLEEYENYLAQVSYGGQQAAGAPEGVTYTPEALLQQRQFALEGVDALAAQRAQLDPNAPDYQEQLRMMDEQMTRLRQQADYFYNEWLNSSAGAVDTVRAQQLAQWLEQQFAGWQPPGMTGNLVQPGAQQLPPWIEEAVQKIRSGDVAPTSVAHLLTRGIPSGYFGTEYQDWMKGILPQTENLWGRWASPQQAKLLSGQTMKRMTPSQLEGLGGYVDWSAGKTPGSWASAEDYWSRVNRMMGSQSPKGTLQWRPGRF